jgi:hypothetical protein
MHALIVDSRLANTDLMRGNIGPRDGEEPAPVD